MPPLTCECTHIEQNFVWLLLGYLAFHNQMHYNHDNTENTKTLRPSKYCMTQLSEWQEWTSNYTCEWQLASGILKNEES